MTGASPIGKEYDAQAYAAAAYLVENQIFPVTNDKVTSMVSLV